MGTQQNRKLMEKQYLNLYSISTYIIYSTAAYHLQLIEIALRSTIRNIAGVKKFDSTKSWFEKNFEFCKFILVTLNANTWPKKNEIFILQSIGIEASKSGKNRKITFLNHNSFSWFQVAYIFWFWFKLYLELSHFTILSFSFI